MKHVGHNSFYGKESHYTMTISKTRKFICKFTSPSSRYITFTMFAVKWRDFLHIVLCVPKFGLHWLPRTCLQPILCLVRLRCG